jgi:hypothetical protein
MFDKDCNSSSVPATGSINEAVGECPIEVPSILIIQSHYTTIIQWQLQWTGTLLFGILYHPRNGLYWSVLQATRY